ncbi:hypothetical protein [Actinacidiphila acidipaludis]|uniref:Integral membrane protein n=1 Tax=Actinacidiphila acidipaludis TaxID=2873382 RepID=A0ABS7Q945_9ACTN|nr:hypothetical protein [Streptomyces acidipaludis]MBY8879680.1 hypothetical protein [Streptomyces acidipaludis]
MTGHGAGLAQYAGLAAVASAGVCWLNLARRFADKGRLAGSRYSVGLTFAVVTVTVTVAVTTTVLLSRTQGLPAAAAGVLAGAGVFPRARQTSADTSRALTRVMSLGIAYLTDRLVDRMRRDEAAWCEAMLAGFKDFAQMQTFVHTLTVDYLQPRLDPKLYTDAEQRLRAAGEALAAAAECHERIDAACRQADPPDTPRKRTMPEQLDYDRAAGEARKSVKFVLALVYQHGRRSEDAALQRIRYEAAPDAFEAEQVPQQRRRAAAAPQPP